MYTARAYRASHQRNPNYHVSTVRLHFRNLPASTDEKKLRALCAEAIGQDANTALVRVSRPALRSCPRCVTRLGLAVCLLCR